LLSCVDSTPRAYRLKAGNAAWKVSTHAGTSPTAQVPLYTVWHTGTTREVVQAIMHCTLGDILIETVTVVAALLSVGSPAWPDQRFGQVLAATVIFAAGYTVYSEYVNTVVRHSWSYTSWMPTLPWLGTGLAPLAQWMVVPATALAWAGRVVPVRKRPDKAPQSTT
jgi:hypothetical protein